MRNISTNFYGITSAGKTQLHLLVSSHGFCSLYCELLNVLLRCLEPRQVIVSKLLFDDMLKVGYRRVIPQYILDKISFVTSEELAAILPVESIPAGECSEMSLSCPIHDTSRLRWKIEIES